MTLAEEGFVSIRTEEGIVRHLHHPDEPLTVCERKPAALKRRDVGDPSTANCSRCLRLAGAS